MGDIFQREKITPIYNRNGGGGGYHDGNRRLLHARSRTYGCFTRYTQHCHNRSVLLCCCPVTYGVLYIFIGGIRGYYFRIVRTVFWRTRLSDGKCSTDSQWATNERSTTNFDGVRVEKGSEIRKLKTERVVRNRG